MVPFDNNQKVEDVLKVLCGRLSLGAGNTKEDLEGFELRLASNNCLLVPSDLACSVLSDGDYVVVGKDRASRSRRSRLVCHGMSYVRMSSGCSLCY